MEVRLQLYLLVGVFLYLGIIFSMLKRRKLSVKYSLVWLLTAVVLLLITLFPGFVGFCSKLIGIRAPINLVFIIAGLFVLLIILSLTTIVSLQTNRIRGLTQSLALLESRVRELEEE